MPEKEEFLSFDRVLKELKLKDEELKRLVSEGEIRAYRDAEKMKFKKEDVERLKKDTGKTIQFTEESGETLTDDLLFDEDDLKLADEDAGMATAQITSEDTFIDDKKKNATTTPVKKQPQEKAKPESKKPSTTSSTRAPSGSRTTTSSAGARRTTSTRSATMAKPVAAPGEISMISTLLVVATSLLLLWGAAFWMDISSGSMRPITEGFAKAAENWFTSPDYPETLTETGK